MILNFSGSLFSFDLDANAFMGEGETGRAFEFYVLYNLSIGERDTTEVFLDESSNLRLEVNKLIFSGVLDSLYC